MSISTFRGRRAPRAATLASLGLVLALAVAAPAQEVSYQSYALQHAQAAEVEPALARSLAEFGLQAELIVEPRANRVLVRGGAAAQRAVAELLGSLDRPAVVQRGEPVLRGYPLPAAELTAVVARLRSLYPPESQVRIAADTRTSQMLVLAPPEVHAQISGQMNLGAAGGPPTAEVTPATPGGSKFEAQFRDAQTGAPLPQARPAWNNPPANTGVAPVAYQQPAYQPAAQPEQQRQPVYAQQPAQPQPAQPAVGGAYVAGRVLSLRGSTWQQFERSLAQMGVRAAGDPQAAAAAAVVEYPLPTANGSPLSLVVDRRLNQVVIHGAGPLADAAERFTAALDAGPRAGIQVVPVRKSQPATVRQAVDSVAQAGIAGEEPAAEAVPERRPFVARVFQPAQPEGAAAQPEQPGVQPGAVEAEPAGTPGRPVRVEYLEGLDIFVLSGPKADVERVRRLIEDIERISETTEPMIQLYNLKHVDSQALSLVVTQLYDQILSPRQGRVSITPLIKPNSILLIGRPDSVESVSKLIERLDTPVGPATQFETFRLRYASASAAKQILDEFLGASPGTRTNTGAAAGTRPGLGTKVVVTADFRSNSLIVQASPRDMAEVALLVQKIDVADSDAVNELRVFKLDNSLADELAPILQSAITGQTGRQGGGGGLAQALPGGGQAQGPTQVAAGDTSKSTVLRFLTLDAKGQRKLQSGILTDVRITSDPRANALLVSAPAQSMELIAALVDQLDKIPAAVAQIKVFTVVNGDATGMVEMLQSLFGQGQQQAGRLGVGQIGPQAQQTTVQGESALVPLRFSVDQRTNSIIASGAGGDLNIVEAILLRLDSSDVRQRKNHVYRLKNSPALDVSNAVNEFLRSQRNVQQIAPQAMSPFEQIEREVIVVPEPVSNSLIVSATPRYFDEIAQVVEQLDRRPPMVMIQVLIAEVALNNTDEFGVELGIQDSVLFDRGIIGDLVTTTTTTATAAGQIQNTEIVSSTTTPGFNFNNQPLGNNASNNSTRFGPQALTNFAVGRVNGELGFGGLVLSGGNENLSLLIRALKECRRLDVLSRPQVCTLDNQPAFIQVGQRVPRITNTTVSPTGTQNGITLENVGLIMGVTPRISPDGLVVMEIDAEKSDVGPEAEGIPISISTTGDTIRSPRINITTAQTTVSAVSGQTIVLGGLITKSKSQTSRRAPVLSNIPILGNLFRYDGVVTRRTELLIIMTPHVIRGEADAERVKRMEASRMSWCLADVHKIYGPAGLRGPGDEWLDAETMTIFPDLDPTGSGQTPPLTPPEPPDAGPRLPSDDAPPQASAKPASVKGKKQRTIWPTAKKDE